MEARKQQLFQAGLAKSVSENKDLNPRPGKSAKPIVSSCDICNIELNSVEELQVHIKQNHADDDDESGKYFSDDDSLVEDTSPDDPNLKCVECDTQYKKPNQFENHMKKRHGGLIVNKSSLSEKENESSLEQFDEDMVDYEEEEELEDEFLENMASQSMERYQDKLPNKQINAKPPIKSGSSW